MITILKALEPREFNANEIIYVELDEVNEVLFIQSGEYLIGYEVNKHEKFKLKMGAKSVIGAFNICFNKRQIFIHKTSTECKGYSIRKQKWKEIMDEANAKTNKLNSDYEDECIHKKVMTSDVL